MTDKQMLEVRAFSTRARITPTSFINEYHWGNFKGDVDRFMTKYYDAFVYFANWGTHDLRFRLPKAGLNLSLVRRYCRSGQAHLRLAGDYAILRLSSEDECGDWEGDEGWMSSLAPLRADVMAGDFRCFYLGWLNCVGCREIEDDKTEPPVPPGLGELTAPLRALADFLRIDDSLIEAAAEASPPLTAQIDSAEDMKPWIEAIPSREKDALLYRLTRESPMAVQRDILRRFCQARQPQQSVCQTAGRTVGQLLIAAEQRTQEKRCLAAEKKAREETRRKEEAAKARQKHLDALAEREALAWQEADAMIHTRQPRKYDEAVRLLRDIRDLAEREGRPGAAIARLNALRDAHSGKLSLLRRLDEAKL